MAPHSIATRALILTLKATGKSNEEITGLTGIQKRTINSIFARAIERGFDPCRRPMKLEDSYLEDGYRSGRPSKQQAVSQRVVDSVRTDRYGREKSCADVAGALSQEGFNISATTVWRVLRKAGFKKTKPTRKPGLTKKMRDARYDWCCEHEHWSIDDWKNVIWSDETAVVINHRRGGYRVWRKVEEAFIKSCIRERWKGYSEFMFWGCFSYDEKGPCHCWTPETKKEKEAATAYIEQLNRELEPIMRSEWELETGMRRLDLRNKPGRQPQWAWNKKTGKLARGSSGGIDWYRYQTTILLPKLIPFAKQCKAKRPRTVVQEDKAPAHAHYAQSYVYSLYDVEKLLWCGNSPDLNAIEPCWPWMKRYTTKKGAPKSRAEAIRVWEQCWRDLPQEKIQAWIERIPVHVKEIIRLEGGNEYKEGRRLYRPETPN